MTREAVLRRCGLSEIATPTWTLAEDARGYGEAGFAAIGIWLHKLERPRIDGFWIPEATIPPSVVEAASEAVRAGGLQVSHLVLSGFYTEPERADRIEHTLHAMDVADALDASCVVIAPGRRNGRSYDDTRDYAARALTEVFERASKPAVRLALEPIIAWQSDYLNTLGEALDLAELVDHPNLGVYPDTFHLWRTGTLLEDVERAGARIFGVHLNDAVEGDDRANRLPGEGELPLVEIVRAIEATGYTGTYDNEYMHDSALPPASVVRRCADAMVAVLEEAGVGVPARG
ncbi:MAG TPA: sugar phosphate isomerase/epimerase family protein [Gaiellaceae bacterium]